MMFDFCWMLLRDLLGIVIVDGLLPDGCAGGAAAAGGCKLVNHFEEERLQKTSLNTS